MRGGVFDPFSRQLLGIVFRQYTVPVYFARDRTLDIDYPEELISGEPSLTRGKISASTLVVGLGVSDQFDAYTVSAPYAYFAAALLHHIHRE